MTMAIGSAEEFVRLRHSESPDEYRRAATESAPIEVWRELVEHYADEHFWVAQNKTVPLEVLSELAGDPDERVRMMVAAKKKLTPDILVRLARDPNDAVRMSVARHRNATRAVLESLRNDSWDAVRDVVAERLS